MDEGGDIHGGNLRELSAFCGCSPEDILDFSANINPLGFPDFTREAIAGALVSLQHYPDKDYAELSKALARASGVDCSEVAAVNGTSEAIMLLPRISGRRKCIVQTPGFSLYTRAADLAGMEIVRVPLSADQQFATDHVALDAAIRTHNPSDCLVFLGHPHNPTGRPLDLARIKGLISSLPEALFVIDEAFIDFAPPGLTLIGYEPAHVVVMRSLTKILALPGLRIGYVVAGAAIIEKIKRHLPPWNVNELASRMASRALDEGADFFAESRSAVEELRGALSSEMQRIDGVAVYPSSANFLMVRLTHSCGPGLVARLLKEEGIALRDLSKMAGLDGRFLRVAVRRKEENERLVAALRRALSSAGAPALGRVVPASAASPKKWPPLMLLGTGSDVGKSVLTAALCRIFVQDGFRVAPFKAQNMALNSHVARDGGEIGRAQAVQAEACKIDSDVRMNPILLKPSSDHNSQLIVAGKPVGTFSYGAFLQKKKELFAHALGAFRSLAQEYDLVVLEGAGGASEINLKKNDIVNMAMARAAGARVLLVGDIDRGGVFGSLVGTLETMAEWERRHVRGMIINKFRGDQTLLADGLCYLERRLGLPVLGVVPHIDSIAIPDEDSVTFKRLASPEANKVQQDRQRVEIAVIDTPRISNVTDIDPLRLEPDTIVRIVRGREDFGRPDAVILAGSKNVIADLEHLRVTGIAPLILAHAKAGGTVVGICGGLQMLGRRIEDPLLIESTGGGCDGLGLLALATSLKHEKLLGRVSARFSGRPDEALYGYEIHHGVSECCDPSCEVTMVSDAGHPLGYGARGGAVWGTYLHGVFDGDLFRRRFIDYLRVASGLAPVGEVVAFNSLEAALDRLAGTVRKSLDMERIYKILGASEK